MIQMRRLDIHRVGLLVKPKITNADPVIEKLSRTFVAHGVELWAEEGVEKMSPHCRAHFASREELARSVDLLIVLGGDGTMLAASRLVGERRIPVLGVNFGGLGYLTEFTLDELFPVVEALFAGEVAVDSRLRLDAFVSRQGQVVADYCVLNDAVVNTSALARMIEIECFVGAHYVTTFRADGIIVSTPTGSTAYSLSAGGPIVHPDVSAIIVTPICPHMLTNRPLVISDQSEVRLRLRTAREEATLTLDGQVGFALHAGDEVMVRKSAKMFDLVCPMNKNYFQVLRDKLHWGR